MVTTQAQRILTTEGAHQATVQTFPMPVEGDFQLVATVELPAARQTKAMAALVITQATVNDKPLRAIVTTTLQLK